MRLKLHLGIRKKSMFVFKLMFTITKNFNTKCQTFLNVQNYSDKKVPFFVFTLTNYQNVKIGHKNIICNTTAN